MSAGFFIGGLIGVVMAMGVTLPIQYWIEVGFTRWLLVPLIICGAPLLILFTFFILIILGF